MSSSIKRVKLSGAAYRRQREERKEENQRSARTMHNFLLPVESVTVPVPDISFVESPPIDSNLDETIASSSVRDTVGIESNSEESNSMTGPESEIHDVDKVDPDIFHDAGVWNIPLSDPIRIELVSRGPVDLQNKEGPLISVEKHGSRGEKNSITFFGTVERVYSFFSSSTH